MASDKEVAEIKEALGTITRLLAAQIGAELKVAERAPLLPRLGLQRNAIAGVCGTNPEVVSVRLAESRREGRKGRRNSGGTRVRVEADV